MTDTHLDSIAAPSNVAAALEAAVDHAQVLIDSTPAKMLVVAHRHDRPDEIRRDAFATDVVTHVSDQLVDITIVEGTPAGPVTPGR